MRISQRQYEALESVQRTGNFSLYDKFVTKASVCARSLVEASQSRPLQLTPRGKDALEAYRWRDSRAIGGADA